MVGDEPFPSTVAFPFEGAVKSDQASEVSLESESVALSSFVDQVVNVSSFSVLVRGPAPCVITGAWLLAEKVNKVIVTFP